MLSDCIVCYLLSIIYTIKYVIFTNACNLLHTFLLNYLLCHHSYFEGVKFIVVTDTKQMGQDNLLKKLYELYSDYALKNPFYSIDMPIR